MSGERPVTLEDLVTMYGDFAAPFLSAVGDAPEGMVWVAQVDMLGQPGPHLTISPRRWEDLADCKARDLDAARKVAATMSIAALLVLHRCGSCPDWHVSLSGIMRRQPSTGRSS